MRHHLSIALMACLCMSVSVELYAQECVTPLEWRSDLGSQWDRDTNGNNAEDDLEALSPDDLVDVLLDLNGCATAQDFERFEQFGTLGYVGKSISVVQLLNVHADDAVALGKDPRVSMVEIDREVTAALDVSNPAIRVRASATYSPNTIQDQFPSLDGTGINIAILDTGVDDGQHESLPGSRFVGGFNVFTGTEGNPDDDHGHGTHVAGIALGSGGAAGTFRGVAPGAGLVDVKVLAANGRGSFAGVIAGIDKCIQRRTAWSIGVINMSLGGSVPSNGLDATSQAVNRAVQTGIVVVVAAGNAGPASLISTPAAADDAITVAASSSQGTVVRTDDGIASFSSRGPRSSDGDADTADERKPDVTAPGVSIRSAKSDTVNVYIPLSGTSMAAPHVAGLAALVLQAQPGLLPLSVKQRLLLGAEDFGPAGWDAAWGNGLVNGLDAVRGLCSPTDLKATALAPRNPKIVQGVPNTIRGTVCNLGPNAASGFQVRIGFYDYGGSRSYYPLCRIPVAGLAVGACTTVECPWTPPFAGHQCVKMEVVYPCDRDPKNNEEQRNLAIERASSPAGFQMQGADPADFRMQVVNPTGEDVDVEILTSFDPKCSGWSFTQSDTGFPLRAAECPRLVDFHLTPLPGTVTSCRVDISIRGIKEDNTPVDLGRGTLAGSKAEDVPAPPSCVLSGSGTDAMGRKFITVTARDTVSGLAQINVLRSENSTVTVPAFDVTTIDPVVVTATKIDPNTSSIVELEVFDVDQHVTQCDPVMVEIDRATGRPVTQTVSGIPRAEHYVSVYNGNPGLTSLSVEVNGRKFQLGGLKPGEVRDLDVASAMVEGNGNTILFTAQGRPGGDATLLIHD